MSLTLGAVLAVSDFGISLPSGAVWPVLPLPFVNLGVSTQWFTMFANLPLSASFTIAPQSRLRGVASVRLGGFRGVSYLVDDLIYEGGLWFRLAGPDHRFGDFAGIGVGVKNESTSFTIASDEGRGDRLALRRASVFAAVDLTALQVRGGWTFNSSYIFKGNNAGSPGRGFFVSVQGAAPIFLW